MQHHHNLISEKSVENDEDVLVSVATAPDGRHGPALAASLAGDAGRTVVGPALQQGHVRRGRQAGQGPAQVPGLQVFPQQGYGQCVFVVVILSGAVNCLF